MRPAVRILRRSGKIARLPHAVRLEIGRRLDLGESPKVILAWLNAEAVVQGVLWRHFHGSLITAENLSEWNRCGRKTFQWLAPRPGKKRGSKSKIELFPDQIRVALNRRLLDGQTGEQILAWLNSRPAVRAILRTKFAGRPVNHENLSHYRHNGFSEWLAAELISNRDA